MTVMPDTTPTERSSHLSPNVVPPHSWGPPRAPLSPHRLAKLANALGVSTPVPITHSYSLPPLSPPTQPNSSASSSFPDHFRRSPTPSIASAQAHTPTSSTSKYLLHVVPPEHLPHEHSDVYELAPPPSASGYHKQFRRGVMVPVYPTLQNQLSAIAREYALPSTVGMVLYLITTPSTPSAISDKDEFEEPGPRLSDDIWKHIWTRVLRAERDEVLTEGPKPFGLGFGIAGRSSPALLQDVAANGQSFRSLISPRRFDSPQPQPASSPLTPSPSTASNSAYSSQSEIDTPESASSVSVDGAANALPLSGLNSPALIPILAKVEFDIDRHKAGWYEPWVRSRRMNHAKRAESRMGARRMDSMSEAAESVNGDGESGSLPKRVPLDLELVNRMQTPSPAPSFLLTTEASAADVADEDEDGEVEADTSYQPLAESPVEDNMEPEEELELDEEGLGDEGLEDEELTTRLDSNVKADPLADVFGTDGETWADLHTESESRRTSKRQTNRNVVDLALDAAALSALPDDLEESDEEDKSDDEGEITALINRLSRPALEVSIPSSPPTSDKRRSSPTTSGTIKRHIPPPLNLTTSLQADLPVPALTSPMSLNSAHSAQLAYLHEGRTPSDMDEFVSPVMNGSTRVGPAEGDSTDEEPLEEDVFQIARSPEDEKRDGAIFDDLNLGLDPSLMDDGSEYDDTDPNDRRRSQYIMSATLDEIEKNLAQFSPRRLKSEVLAEDVAPLTASTLSPPRSISARSQGNPQSPPKRPTSSTEAPSWPAVPYAALNGNDSPRLSSTDADDLPPSPPKFAFNGISTEPPKSPFQQRATRSGSISDETLARKRALEEERGLYPPLAPPSLFRDRGGSDSPVIPLSPDPFGRFPSQAEAAYSLEEARNQAFQDELTTSEDTFISPPNRLSSLAAPVHDERPLSQVPSSRFSLDSTTSEEASSRQQKGTSSLMSVKSIRKLWRKSGKTASISSSAPPVVPESGRTSPNVQPLTVPSSQNGRLRSKSTSRPPPPDMLPPAEGLQVPPPRDPPIRLFQFDQESRYPLHPSRSPPMPMVRTPSPPVPSVPPNNRPPSVTQQAPGSEKEKSSVRKSILKSWKSASGLSASSSKGSSSRPPSSSTTPRSSMEQTSDGGRRRRPSVLELASNAMRGSMVSNSSGTLVNDIPPSPALPEQFINQSRASSRASQLTLNGPSDRRDSSARSRPSMSSSSTTSSPPRVRSPLNASSPPRNGLTTMNSRNSGDSYESRPSFDVSQFEMVSPPKAALSYPYHGLDQSMTSHE